MWFLCSRKILVTQPKLLLTQQELVYTAIIPLVVVLLCCVQWISLKETTVLGRSSWKDSDLKGTTKRAV